MRSMTRSDLSTSSTKGNVRGKKVGTRAEAPWPGYGHRVARPERGAQSRWGSSPTNESARRADTA